MVGVLEEEIFGEVVLVDNGKELLLGVGGVE